MEKYFRGLKARLISAQCNSDFNRKPDWVKLVPLISALKGQLIFLLI